MKFPPGYGGEGIMMLLMIVIMCLMVAMDNYIGRRLYSNVDHERITLDFLRKAKED